MSQCLTPFLLKLQNIMVPCGRCPACLARRASGWSFRLMQEERYCSSAWFITLTYDNEHVPITENNFLTINKSHVQKFFRTLRRNHDKRYFNQETRRWNTVRDVQIKYFAVGEYGGRFKRPHYHAIVFNACVEKIQSAWVHGSVHYGYVSYASVGYCMKYMSKPAKVGKFKRDDRVKEFALQSKGLGLCYLTEAVKRWHRATTDRMYVNLDGNKKAAMPRYYKQKIWNKQEQEVIGKLTMERAYAREADRLRVHGNIPFREEAVRAAFCKAGIEFSEYDKEREYAKFKTNPDRRAA